VADRAVQQIFGGAGYVADHGIDASTGDVRIFRIYEGHQPDSAGGRSRARR